MGEVEAYRFGSFELRPRDYTLVRSGAIVRISPKAFDALRYLVERSGQVVGKDALMAALWPNTSVEEANLSVQIAAVRRALATSTGDSFIETVPKRGYRFTASVDVVHPAGSDQVRAERAQPPLAAIVVLPLKILRGHAEWSFLAFSLPDAIAASLAERPDMVVQSPIAATRYGGADADLQALAAVARARFALAGTVTQLEDRIAIHLQLLELPAATVMWSDSRTAAVHEMFAVQGAIAGRVAQSIAASVGATPAASHVERDVPASPGAYAFYLRANQLAYEASRWAEARELYRASLDADPGYAPAWARLARVERLIGKFSASSAEAAAQLARAEAGFQRALALNPDLSIGHSLYAQLMIDLGRADEAMRLLLERTVRRPSDPELYAGLVHALRYCGLLEASLAAHRRARALDPTIATSVHHTWWMLGQYERALAETLGDIGYMQGLALASLGREQEAIAALRWRERETTDGRIRPYLTSLRALLEGDHTTSRAAVDAATDHLIDAEAVYYIVRTVARLGDHDRAAVGLRRVVDGGFWCVDTFMRDPWLDGIRGRPDVRQLIEVARARRARARAVFSESESAKTASMRVQQELSMGGD